MVSMCNFSYLANPELEFAPACPNTDDPDCGELPNAGVPPNPPGVEPKPPTLPKDGGLPNPETQTVLCLRTCLIREI